jgi:hypothetical protein
MHRFLIIMKLQTPCKSQTQHNKSGELDSLPGGEDFHHNLRTSPIINAHSI